MPDAARADPTPIPRYNGVTTLIMHSADSRQLASLDSTVWPGFGSVVEFGNPNRDGIVTEVRLRLPQHEHSGALILVYVDDPEIEGNTIPRQVGDRIVHEDDS
ncbi:MAG: hypothetical protein M3256_11645 [Actinomycetota bacterium]|nr:hypothetical protein [Actinomycetota bacterium]